MSQIRVLNVTAVEAQILKSNPPQLVIVAHGTVPTSGWGDGALVPWRYIKVPHDRIQDFDFIATPPTGIVIKVTSLISAQIHAAVDIDNYWGPGVALAGVKIHARESQILFELNNPSSFLASDPVVPWPWAVG